MHYDPQPSSGVCTGGMPSNTEQSPFVAEQFPEPRKHDYPVLLHSCCLRGTGSEISSCMDCYELDHALL